MCSFAVQVQPLCLLKLSPNAHLSFKFNPGLGRLLDLGRLFSPLSKGMGFKMRMEDENCGKVALSVISQPLPCPATKTTAIPPNSRSITSSVIFMAKGPSNEAILEQLKYGLAEFELTSSPVTSVSCLRPLERPFSTSVTVTDHRFFARIGPSIGGGSPALKKVERYSVQKVTGDGRCLFRALVQGMAFNKGIALSPLEERDNADELRMAVKEVICDNTSEHLQYEEALIAITVEQSLKRYCQLIGRADFWGGESELLVLSRLCGQPIRVYIPEHEHGGQGYGFIPIAEYGAEFCKGSAKRKPRQVVRLLYSELISWMLESL